MVYSPEQDSFMVEKEIILYINKIRKTMGHPILKDGVCKAPCFWDDPKLKTSKLRPNSKELGFKFMDIKNKNIKVLDMGSGSGIQAKACIKSGIKKSNILCAEVDKEAIVELKKQKLNTIESNLFSNIKKKKKFDLIIFNPPYLPESKYDNKPDTTAGKQGYELIIRFLKQAKPYLTKNGIILLLFSSLSKPRIILKEAKKLKFKAEKLAEQTIFFEKLFVYKFA